VSLSTIHTRTAGAAECRILGVRLLPLRVGHLLHLEAEEVDPVRTPADLATAIRICSMPPSEWVAWKGSALTPFRLLVWGRALGQWDFAEKLALWKEYVRWHTELPVMKLSGNARESHIPAYRFTRVKLMRLGYRPHEVDDATYLDALWDLAAAAEIDGRAEAMDGTEADLDAAALAVDAEEIKRKATEELLAELKGKP
jgi:hypothetical protein